MNLPLRFRPEVGQDIREAFDWYDQRREGLGREFLLSLKAALAEVRRSPESFRAVDGQVRRALTRRFPYAVFFVTGREEILVFAVFHTKRDPRRLRDRKP